MAEDSLTNITQFIICSKIESDICHIIHDKTVMLSYTLSLLQGEVVFNILYLFENMGIEHEQL